MGGADSTLPRSFGTLLRLHRRRLDLTQENLAEQAGFSVDYVKKLEAGIRRPSRISAGVLGRALGLDDDEASAFLATARAPQVTRPIAQGSRTVTFLFTDVEGGAQAWSSGEAESGARALKPGSIIRASVEAHGGILLRPVGDAFRAAFSSASEALRCAVQAQQTLLNDLSGVRMRMALHTGEARERDGDYHGPPVRRVSRMLNDARGGQVLLSRATQELVRDDLPRDVELLAVDEVRSTDQVRPEQVFQVVGPMLPDDRPRLGSRGAPPTNLPVQPTPFIGRRREIEGACELLRDDSIQLLTLTGPGGTGKTRLALELGRRMLEIFPDGVYVAELDLLLEPEQVMTGLRASLGVPEGAGGELETVARWLGRKRALLILDNFEHVVDAALGLVEVLNRCPYVKMLVTSRRRLRLAREHVFFVRPLSAPVDFRAITAREALEHESIQLFVQRARAARNEFELTDMIPPAVAAICVRLDGLPLAIEQVAARINMFRPGQILERMTTGGQGTLTTLGADRRGGPSRHAALHACMAWSYDLLSDDAQTVFRRRSVFRGGCTFEALEAVCCWDGRDALLALDELIEGSLVREEAGHDDRSRYDMLETIYAFAATKLDDDEREGLRGSHAGYFLTLSNELQKLENSDRAMALGRMEDDHENFLVAIRFLLSIGRRADASRVAGNIGCLWLSGYFGEGRRVLSAVLPPHGQESEADMASLFISGRLAVYHADLDEAAIQLERALRLARDLSDPRKEADVLLCLSTVASDRGDLDGALKLAEQSRVTAVSCLHEEGVANAAGSAGIVWRARGGDGAALALYREAEATRRRIRDWRGLAIDLANIGEVLFEQDDLDGAERAFREAISLADESRNVRAAAFSQADLAAVLEKKGDLDGGLQLLKHSIKVQASLGDVDELRNSLTILARLATSAHDVRVAVTVLGFIQKISADAGMPIGPGRQEQLAQAKNEMRDDGEWKTAWERGMHMTADEALEFALMYALPAPEKHSESPKG